MSNSLEIWIDRLRDGETQKIEGSFDSSFLSIEEKELVFSSPVVVHGEAYLADTHLVIHLKASTQAKMPCAICNEMIDMDVKIDNFYHAEAIEELRGAVFDCSAPLRDTLLLEIPQYAECRGGHCPERATIAPYLKKTGSNPDNKTQFPFAGLDTD